jgi:hypothetical protein
MDKTAIIKMPFVGVVSDYHDFYILSRSLINAGLDLEYIEVDCGMSKYWDSNHGGYHAVFFPKGKQKEYKERIDALSAEVQKEIEENALY